jgi:hypothetical protein
VLIPTGVLDLHPRTDDAIVRWVAPSAGKYLVTGSFQGIDRTPTGVQLLLYAGAQQLFSSSLNGFGSTVPFTFTHTFLAGESLDFGVNSSGSFFNDSTAFTATIQSVPAPDSLTLMLVGGLSLLSISCGRRRRRSRSGAIETNA